jgi:hypothetical protein
LTCCPATTTLFTGPSKSQSSCHRALLGFYSEFFYAASFGNFAGASTQEVTLPEHVADEVQIFVSWVYSGQISGAVEPEKLWILGDKLRSPLFKNETMHLLFSKYAGNWPLEDDAELVYKNTAEVSKLRMFIADTIVTNGPLAEKPRRNGEKQQNELMNSLR